MSMWTHITACLSVDTCIAEKRPILRKLVKQYLKNAPEITGSEGPAEVFVNIQGGHNFYTSYDCEHCEYKDTLRDITVDGLDYQECDAPDGHDCSGEYQSCIVISIQGDLRDRIPDQTKREFEEFLKYIEAEYIIRDYSVNIEGG